MASTFTLGTSTGPRHWCSSLDAGTFGQSISEDGHCDPVENDETSPQRSVSISSRRSDRVSFSRMPELYSHPDDKFDESMNGQPFRPTSNHTKTPLVPSGATRLKNNFSNSYMAVPPVPVPRSRLSSASFNFDSDRLENESESSIMKSKPKSIDQDEIDHPKVALLEAPIQPVHAAFFTEARTPQSVTSRVTQLRAILFNNSPGLNNTQINKEEWECKQMHHQLSKTVQLNHLSNSDSDFNKMNQSDRVEIHDDDICGKGSPQIAQFGTPKSQRKNIDIQRSERCTSFAPSWRREHFVDTKSSRFPMSVVHADSFDHSSDVKETHILHETTARCQSKQPYYIPPPPVNASRHDNIELMSYKIPSSNCLSAADKHHSKISCSQECQHMSYKHGVRHFSLTDSDILQPEKSNSSSVKSNISLCSGLPLLPRSSEYSNAFPSKQNIQYFEEIHSYDETKASSKPHNDQRSCEDNIELHPQWKDDISCKDNSASEINIESQWRFSCTNSDEPSAFRQEILKEARPSMNIHCSQSNSPRALRSHRQTQIVEFPSSIQQKFSEKRYGNDHACSSFVRSDSTAPSEDSFQFIKATAENKITSENEKRKPFDGSTIRRALPKRGHIKNIAALFDNMSSAQDYQEKKVTRHTYGQLSNQKQHDELSFLTGPLPPNDPSREQESRTQRNSHSLWLKKKEYGSLRRHDSEPDLNKEEVDHNSINHTKDDNFVMDTSRQGIVKGMQNEFAYLSHELRDLSIGKLSSSRDTLSQAPSYSFSSKQFNGYQSVYPTTMSRMYSTNSEDISRERSDWNQLQPPGTQEFTYGQSHWATNQQDKNGGDQCEVTFSENMYEYSIDKTQSTQQSQYNCSRNTDLYKMVDFDKITTTFQCPITPKLDRRQMNTDISATPKTSRSNWMHNQQTTDLRNKIGHLRCGHQQNSGPLTHPNRSNHEQTNKQKTATLQSVTSQQQYEGEIDQMFKFVEHEREVVPSIYDQASPDGLQSPVDYAAISDYRKEYNTSRFAGGDAQHNFMAEDTQRQELHNETPGFTHSVRNDELSGYREAQRQARSICTTPPHQQTTTARFSPATTQFNVPGLCLKTYHSPTAGKTTISRFENNIRECRSSRLMKSDYTESLMREQKPISTAAEELKEKHGMKKRMSQIIGLLTRKPATPEKNISLRGEGRPRVSDIALKFMAMNKPQGYSPETEGHVKMRQPFNVSIKGSMTPSATRRDGPLATSTPFVKSIDQRCETPLLLRNAYNLAVETGNSCSPTADHTSSRPRSRQNRWSMPVERLHLDDEHLNDEIYVNDVNVECGLHEKLETIPSMDDMEAQCSNDRNKADHTLVDYGIEDPNPSVVPTALATSTPLDTISGGGARRRQLACWDDSFISTITTQSFDAVIDMNRQIQRLKHQLDVQEEQILMTEKVLSLARKKHKTLHELTAQRTLLVARERVAALRCEMQRVQALSAVRRPPPPVAKDMRGTMLISNITIHLNRNFCNRSVDMHSSYAFLVILKCGVEVEATSPVTLVDSHMKRVRQLHFAEHVRFGNLPVDFSVHLEMYAMRMRDPKTDSDPSCAGILATKARNLLTPTTARKQLRAEVSDSGVTPIGEFIRCGTITLNRDTVGAQRFYVDGAEYPLEGTIEITSRCTTLPSAVEVDFRGFLTMYQVVAGLGSWVRFWAVLRRGLVHFWKYPDDEMLDKAPVAVMDLCKCTDPAIDVAPLDVCSRPYAFSVDMLVTTAPTLIEKKRVLLSADSRELCQAWLEALNETLGVIRGQVNQ